MAVPHLQQQRDLTDEFAEARTFLGERGVFPDSQGNYRETDIPAIEEAIRSRAWNPTLIWTGMTGDWVVEIEDRRAPSQSQIAVAGGPDRITALLRTLRIALTWLTSEEEAAQYDELVQAVMGMSAQEFAKKRHSGELDAGDPRVIYLMKRRPIGW